MKSKLQNPNKSNRNPKQKSRLSKNPKNPYIKDLKKVIEFQKQLDSYNVRNQFPDIKEWVAINWKADEGTYDVYKLLYITIQKRIAEYNKENLFTMGNLNQKYDEAWGKFFELVKKLSNNHGYINLKDLIKDS